MKVQNGADIRGIVLQGECIMLSSMQIWTHYAAVHLPVTFWNMCILQEQALWQAQLDAQCRVYIVHLAKRMQASCYGAAVLIHDSHASHAAEPCYAGVEGEDVNLTLLMVFYIARAFVAQLAEQKSMTASEITVAVGTDSRLSGLAIRRASTHQMLPDCCQTCKHNGIQKANETHPDVRHALAAKPCSQ